MRRWLPLAGALIATTVATAPAGAATPQPKQATFALAAAGAPVLRANPGETVAGAVAVRNLTPHAVVVRLQPTDIRNATNGNADYVATDLSGAGGWIELETRRVRLAAHAAQRVRYTLTVPDTASGASHYAGVVGVDLADSAPADPEPATSESSFTFERVNRLAVPITVHLPGPRIHSLALTSARIEVVPAGAGLVLGLLPEGTELIPQTEVDLEVTRDRQVILSHEGTLGQLFPGDPFDHRIAWAGRPAEGEYRVLGELRPEGAPVVAIDRTVTFTAEVADELEEETVPAADTQGLPLWMWIALAAAGALVLTCLLAMWRMRRRLSATAPGH